MWYKPKNHLLWITDQNSKKNNNAGVETKIRITNDGQALSCDSIDNFKSQGFVYLGIVFVMHEKITDESRLNGMIVKRSKVYDFNKMGR